MTKHDLLYDFAVVGDICVDKIITVTKPIDSKSGIIHHMQTYDGGTAANFALIISYLGMTRTQIVSAVSKDFKNTQYYQKLYKYVDTDFIDHYTLNGDMSTCLIINDDNNNQTTYFYNGVKDLFDTLPLPDRKCVHITCGDPCYNVRVAENSEFVSFNPGQALHTYTKEQLVKIINKTNILFVNEFELELIQNKTEMTLDDIKKIVYIVVVTKGSAGSTAYCSDKTIDVRCCEANCVDPTGAGDSYQAGFLFAYAFGMPLETCMRIGSAVASFVVEHFGCQTYLPEWDDVVERYIKNGGCVGGKNSLDGNTGSRDFLTDDSILCVDPTHYVR